MHWKSMEDLGNLKKVSWVETSHWTRKVDFHLLAETLGGCRMRWGCSWETQNKKIVPLSPHVEKPLNSKVIKSFIPEQRSRKWFSCFQIPMFYVIYIYIYIYEHYMSISHIAVSSNGTSAVVFRQSFVKSILNFIKLFL